MSNILDVPQNFSTTLNVGGGIDNSQTSGIVLTSVTGLPTDGGILAFDWANPIVTTAIEYIEYSGLSSNTLTGVTRGQEGFSARTHANGATVVGVVSRAHIKRLKDNFTAEHDRSTGVHNNLTVLTVNQQTTPSNPSSGKNSFYIKSDGLLYTLTSAGVETAISVPQDAWLLASETWTYASVDGPTFTFTISGDKSTKYQPGMRIKLTQSATVKYFIITAVSYVNPNTTITCYGGTDYTLANAAISANYFTSAKAPFGFPLDPTKWTETLRDTSDRSSSPAASTWTNFGSLSLSIPIGIWRVWYSVVLQANTTTQPVIYVTLSTANNSQSDIDLTSIFSASASSALNYTATKEKMFVLAAKTSYFLNGQYTGTVSILGFYGAAYAPTIIKAVCAYL